MPRRRTDVPASGSSSPAISFSIVDLPEPFAPTTPTRAPGSIAKSRPSSTVRLPNDLRTAFRLTRAMAASWKRERPRARNRRGPRAARRPAAHLPRSPCARRAPRTGARRSFPRRGPTARAARSRAAAGRPARTASRDRGSRARRGGGRRAARRRGAWRRGAASRRRAGSRARSRRATRRPASPPRRHHAVAIRARRPVSAQRAPSTAQPPIANTTRRRASRRKLRRLRLMKREYGAQRLRASAATTIRRHPSGGSLQPVYAEPRARPLGVDPARARPAPALRRQAAAADRAQPRPRRQGAQRHGRRRRPARGRPQGARGARGRSALGQHGSARRLVVAPGAELLGQLVHLRAEIIELTDRHVLALALEDGDQLRQPGAGGPDVLQAVFLEELHRGSNGGSFSARPTRFYGMQRRTAPRRYGGRRLAHLRQGRSERLAAREHGAEQVPVPFDPLERLAHSEPTRRHVLRQLVPPQRRRDRRARLRPHRVDRGDRLSPRVLAVVDEDALALVLQPFGRDQPWVPLLELARHALRELVGVLVGCSASNRDEDVNAVGAARLDVGLELESLELLANQVSDADREREAAVGRV